MNTHNSLIYRNTNRHVISNNRRVSFSKRTSFITKMNFYTVINHTQAECDNYNDMHQNTFVYEKV